jgi:hypothetical protein
MLSQIFTVIGTRLILVRPFPRLPYLSAATPSPIINVSGWDATGHPGGLAMSAFTIVGESNGRGGFALLPVKLIGQNDS